MELLKLRNPEIRSILYADALSSRTLNRSTRRLNMKKPSEWTSHAPAQDSELDTSVLQGDGIERISEEISFVRQQKPPYGPAEQPNMASMREINEPFSPSASNPKAHQNRSKKETQKPMKCFLRVSPAASRLVLLCCSSFAGAFHRLASAPRVPHFPCL